MPVAFTAAEAMEGLLGKKSNLANKPTGTDM